MEKIAVLIPCYNEEQTIAKVVREAKEALPEAVVYVYDNNSTDRTVELAKAQGAVVRYEHKQGKGNVIRRMFREIDARCYLMIDGDDTYPLNCAGEMTDRVPGGRIWWWGTDSHPPILPRTSALFIISETASCAQASTACFTRISRTS